jgi:hypothetical protein
LQLIASLLKSFHLKIFIVLAHWKTVHRLTCGSTRTHYPDFEPASLCSYSYCCGIESINLPHFLKIILFNFLNVIHVQRRTPYTMVSVLTSSAEDLWIRSHSNMSKNKDWLKIRIMCPSRATWDSYLYEWNWTFLVRLLRGN